VGRLDLDRRATTRGLAVLVLVVAVIRPAVADHDRIPGLIETLTTDPSYKVRVSTALVLGKLRDRRAVPALKKVLATDGHYAVRATAAQSLGQIGDAAAIPALEQAAAGDSHDFVRARAQSALTILHAAAGKRVPAPVSAATPRGKERYYVGVGGMADKSKRGGPEMIRRMREFVVRELERTPGVTMHLDPAGKGKKLKAFTLDGMITEIKRSQSRDYVEISCEVSYVIGVYPTRSIVMMTSGGATIQTPRGQFRPHQERAIQVDALENAVKGAHQNLVAFLQKQR
jgi:rhodanese-related sulfurtransferase